MRKHIIYCLLAVAFCTSCSGFLEEHSQTKQYARTCEDLQELIIGNGYFDMPTGQLPTLFYVGTLDYLKWPLSDFYMPWLHVMSDECREWCYSPENLMVMDYTDDFAGMYKWAKNPFIRADGTELSHTEWNKFYKHIAVANTVLNKVEEFTNESEQTRNHIKGQALFIRAINYFYLINVYALPYSPASASSDPGVPLKITPEVEAKDFGRNSVQEVYDQIAKDLTDAAKYLHGTENQSMWYASEAAALSLLSRVYCYMCKWELVSEICDRVIAMNKYRLFNIAGYRYHPDLPYDFSLNFLDEKSPEVIFTQGKSGIDRVFPYLGWGTNPADRKAHYFSTSDELLNLYSAKDMRKWTFFQFTDYTVRFGRMVFMPCKFRSIKLLNPATTTGMLSDVSVIRLAEVYLNKAEALAMTNKEAEAIAALEFLRKERMEPGFEGVKNSNGVAPTGEELVNFIRDERARELCFEGHRWFDLRRYMVSPKYKSSKALEHKCYKNVPLSLAYSMGELVGTAVLKPIPFDEGRWVMPIPEAEIELNHGKLINNLRGDVPLKK